MSTTYYYQPIYRIIIYDDTGHAAQITHIFGTGSIERPAVSSFRIKPGLTSAIGSFELEIPDTGSDANRMCSGSAFKDIDVHNLVHFYYGYTGSGLSITPENVTKPMFVGRIDTKEVSYSENGCIRKFTGRDLGAELFNTRERRAFTGTCVGIIQDVRSGSGLTGGDDFISLLNDADYYTVATGTPFDVVKEVCDFNNKDFYIDTGSTSYIHYFDRQYYNDTSTPFIEGTNIFSYRYIKDLTPVRNDIYVFGVRDSNNTTGSDIPTNHLDFSHSITNWTGSFRINNGAKTSLTPTTDATYYATGSGPSMFVDCGSISVTGQPYELWLRRNLTSSVALNDGDTLHVFYGSTNSSAQASNLQFKLMLGSTEADYYSTDIEETNLFWTTDAQRLELDINVGPSNGGSSVLAAPGQATGSHKWTRIGNPDWYAINYIQLYHKFTLTPGPLASVRIYLDGVYLGTTFQFHSEDTGSISLIGRRTEVINNNRVNSRKYAQTTAETKLNILKIAPIQIEMQTITRPYIIGTQYPITLKTEDVTGSLFELIDCEHNWQNGQLTSKCIFTDQKELRTPIPIINFQAQMAEYKRSVWEDIAYYKNFPSNKMST